VSYVRHCVLLENRTFSYPRTDHTPYYCYILTGNKCIIVISELRTYLPFGSTGITFTECVMTLHKCM
jgi:hypothetical protein